MENNKMLKTIKQIHKEYIVMVKIGTFYHVYGKDAYIISYVFDYKLKEEGDTYTAGFPINSLNKVMSCLEDLKINYITLDRRNNYDVDEKSDNKNLNNYSKYYEKARKQIVYKIRVEKIYEYMKQNINKKECKELILEVEEKINERRKVSSN